MVRTARIRSDNATMHPDFQIAGNGCCGRVRSCVSAIHMQHFRSGHCTSTARRPQPGRSQHAPRWLVKTEAPPPRPATQPKRPPGVGATYRCSVGPSSRFQIFALSPTPLPIFIAHFIHRGQRVDVRDVVSGPKNWNRPSGSTGDRPGWWWPMRRGEDERPGSQQTRTSLNFLQRRARSCGTLPVAHAGLPMACAGRWNAGFRGCFISARTSLRAVRDVRVAIAGRAVRRNQRADQFARVRSARRRSNKLALSAFSRRGPVDIVHPSCNFRFASRYACALSLRCRTLPI